MYPDVDWELLTRYLTGQCSPQEEQEFARWVAQDEAHAAFVTLMRRAWEESSILPSHLDVDAAWRITAARVGIDTPPAKDDSNQPAALTLLESQRMRSNGWRIRFGIAAAVATIAVGGAIWKAIINRPEPIPTFADATRTHITQPGQRMEMRLPDGTRVMLAPASVLRIPDTYGDRSRRVQLEGEGYFEVTHDSRRPFVVHTARGIASDLGTRFVVQALPADTTATVVVAEGVVSLKSQPGADSVLLVRGDLGRLTNDGRLYAEHDVDLDRHLAWTEGRLVFDDTRLSDVVPHLNRWYDLEISFADSTIADMHVSGVFTSEPVSQVLQFLTAPLGLQYDRQGRTIILRKQTLQEQP